MAEFIHMRELPTDKTMADSETETRHRSNGPVDEDESAPRDGGRRSNSDRVRRQDSEEVDEEEEMLYGARHVIKLFVPVSLCMLVVVLTIASVNYYTDQSAGVYLVYTPLVSKSTDSALVTLGTSLGNALIVLGVVVVMTVLLVLLYKYKCYKVLHGWLILSSLLLLFVFSFIYLEAVLHAYNVPFDMITMALFMWNFGCMGMLAMHWKAPLRVLQAYHIVISALLALVFIKYLQEWTLWLILAVIALWDLVAVLCPKGPLRILVNIAHERNENIFPSLIYTSTVAYTVGMADTRDLSDDSQEGTAAKSAGAAVAESTASRPLRESSSWTRREKGYGSEDQDTHRPGRGVRRADDVDVDLPREDADGPRIQEAEEREEPEDKGVKLGLGDFIFYSILVGKASSTGDWAITIAAYIAILMGLFFTLLLLAVYKKALPALPISIAFGLAFNFGTEYLISPFVSELASDQVFV